MSRSNYDQAILDMINDISRTLTRIAEALEEANRLEDSHPSRH